MPTYLNAMALNLNYWDYTEECVGCGNYYVYLLFRQVSKKRDVSMLVDGGYVSIKTDGTQWNDKVITVADLFSWSEVS